jgi:hypothetical protein
MPGTSAVSAMKAGQIMGSRTMSAPPTSSYDAEGAFPDGDSRVDLALSLIGPEPLHPGARRGL